MDWSSLLMCTLYLAHPCTAYDVAFVATATVIRYYDLTNLDGHGTSIAPKNVGDIIAIDYDPYEGYVYWADIKLSIISRAKLNGADEQIIHSNLSVPTSIAIDGITGMLYWIEADEGMQAIKRSYLNGSEKRELIHESLDSPWSIALDTQNGKMYWADIGEHPRIERANLDGSEREVLINDTIVHDISLTLDLGKKRIYWVDRNQTKIMYSDLGGGNPIDVFAENLEHTFSIAVYEETIFGCERAFVFTYDQGSGNSPGYFVTMPEWDLLCLKTATTADGKEIMLACENHGMREFDLTVENDLGRKIELLSREKPAAVDYDVIDDKIYWIDLETKSVKAANRDGSDIKKLADTSKNPRSGLSIDLETDQLFWSERVKHVIRNMTRNGKNYGTFKDNVDSITTLALDTINKYVYWIAYGRTDGKIMKVSYNGSNPTTVLSALQYPGAIVVDAYVGRIYWNEYKVDTIVIADLEGMKVGSILAEDKIRYMSKSGDTIYWYSFNGNIGKVNTETGQQTTMLSASEKEFRSIKIFPSVSSCEHANCINGGTCKSKALGFSCLCTAGFTGRNCEIEIDDCVDVTCLNNGTCVDKINSYKCNCIKGFVGDHCETDVNECQSNPCQNNAVCVDDVSKYHCTCRPGYTGDHCETEIDDCVNVTCLNNGTCVDKINSYKCNCMKGFTGDHCETDVNECQSNPCQNNALCVDDINKYHCACRPGFIGDHCETGLGFLVVIAVVVILTAVIAILVRKGMYQRRLKSSLASQGKVNLFSLVHLPSVRHGQMYSLDDIILG